MTLTRSSTRRMRPLRTALLATSLATLSLASAAGPGAHGPGGEHLDGPGNAATGSALPRLDARSEAFELVAELRDGELAILIDRYETNEPVLGAKLEVESGALKATAAFRTEHGDYAVTDAALVKAIAAPGEHPLVFTLAAGKDSDLLDGTLLIAKPAAAAAGHGRGDSLVKRAPWIAAGIAVLAALSGIAWWRRRRRGSAAAQGGVE